MICSLSCLASAVVIPTFPRSCIASHHTARPETISELRPPSLGEAHATWTNRAFAPLASTNGLSVSTCHGYKRGIPKIPSQNPDGVERISTGAFFGRFIRRANSFRYALTFSVLTVDEAVGQRA